MAILPDQRLNRLQASTDRLADTWDGVARRLDERLGLLGSIRDALGGNPGGSTRRGPGAAAGLGLLAGGALLLGGTRSAGGKTDARPATDSRPAPAEKEPGRETPERHGSAGNERNGQDPRVSRLEDNRRSQGSTMLDPSPEDVIRRMQAHQGSQTGGDPLSRIQAHRSAQRFADGDFSGARRGSFRPDPSFLDGHSSANIEDRRSDPPSRRGRVSGEREYRTILFEADRIVFEGRTTRGRAGTTRYGLTGAANQTGALQGIGPGQHATASVLSTAGPGSDPLALAGRPTGFGAYTGTGFYGGRTGGSQGGSQGGYAGVPGYGGPGGRYGPSGGLIPGNAFGTGRGRTGGGFGRRSSHERGTPAERAAAEQNRRFEGALAGRGAGGGVPYRDMGAAAPADSGGEVAAGKGRGARHPIEGEQGLRVPGGGLPGPAPDATRDAVPTWRPGDPGPVPFPAPGKVGDLVSGANMPRDASDETRDALNAVARENGIDPAALSQVINLESRWNTRDATGSFRGLTQIGPTTFREAGGRLGGMTWEEYQNASPAGQIRAYGDWLRHYDFAGKNREAGIDLGRMSPAEQAAVLQANQFAPNGMDWRRDLAAGRDRAPVTSDPQAAVLGSTSIADMRRYYEGQFAASPAVRREEDGERTPGSFQPAGAYGDRTGLPGASDASAVPTVSPEAAIAAGRGSTDTPASVDDYLWQKYQDGTGKVSSQWRANNQKAAEMMGMSEKDYVIGGMDADFKVNLYTAGRKLDRDGVGWGLSSGYRGDERQAMITSGVRAPVGYSYHGGSVVTGGYGHGKAADVVGVGGTPTGAAREAMQAAGAGIAYPYREDYDQPHAVPAGSAEIREQDTGARIGQKRMSAEDYARMTNAQRAAIAAEQQAAGRDEKFPGLTKGTNASDLSPVGPTPEARPGYDRFLGRRGVPDEALPRAAGKDPLSVGRYNAANQTPADTSSAAAERLRKDSETLKSPSAMGEGSGSSGGGRSGGPDGTGDVAAGKGRGARHRPDEDADSGRDDGAEGASRQLEKATESGGSSRSDQDGGGKSTAKELEDSVASEE